MTKKINIPDIVELLRQKQHRIALEVAESHLGCDLLTVEAQLRTRLDGTGASNADIATWARLISEGKSLP